MPLPVGRAADRARPPVRKRERFEPLTKSLVVMQPPKHGGVNLEGRRRRTALHARPARRRRARVT